jgi:Ser/Thr protein kinase RdoA (MazF antagonist)
VRKPFADLSTRGQVARLKRLALAALPAFGVEAARVVPLQHFGNTTYRVEAPGGSRYVLRVQRPNLHSIAEVRSEVAWLAALRRDTGLSVPEPVPAQDGDLLTVADGEGVPEARVCVLFRWMEGQFVDAGLQPRHLERVGAFTARLHDHAARWTPPPGFVRRRVENLFDAVLDPVDPLSERVVAACRERVGTLFAPEDGALVAAALDRVRAMLADLDEAGGTFGLIHADLHQWNYLFDHGTLCAIDFDDCGYGYFLYDLAVTLSPSSVHYREDYPALRAALLRAYGRLRPLPPDPEQCVETWLIFRRVQLLMWALESRDEPAFATWRDDCADDLRKLRAAMASSVQRGQ